MSYKCYYFSYTNKYIKILDKNVNFYKKRSQAIKVHLSRKGFNFHNLLIDKNLTSLKCAFCDNYNNMFYYITEIQNEEIIIKDIEYFQYDRNKNGSYKDINPIHYCHSDNCPGKKLNPNSVEFVKKTRKLDTDEDAIKYIHKRNKSPFYIENHENKEDYSNYQKRDRKWFEDNNVDFDKSIEKANYKRSLEGRIEIYGEEKGRELFEQECMNKSVNLEKLQLKYGKEKGLEVYTTWKNNIRVVLSNFIRKYGYITGNLKYFEFLSKARDLEYLVTTMDDLVKYTLNKIKLYPFYQVVDFPLLKYYDSDNLIKTFIEFSGYTYNDLTNFIKNIDPTICSLSSDDYFSSVYDKKSAFSQLSLTKNGDLLRSSLELSFYLKIESSVLSNYEYKVDKKYPGSESRYDFYFPDVNVYIEIAGMMRKDSYKDKMASKKEKFNSWIIETYEDQHIAIQKLIEMYKEIK